jgi:hypothetical protein
VYKIVLLCCAGISSFSLMGMQMGKQIIPFTPSTQTGAQPTDQEVLASSHSLCAKACTLLCLPPAIAADILCIFPLCCRLSPIQKRNESDDELMKRADGNYAVAVQHRAAMKQRYGNDACASLHRKIHALLHEKAPHHTQHCEAEWEHLCCFSKAIIKFIKE